MTMEQIVRPFQSPNSINDKKTITTLPKVAKTSSFFEWGKAGAPPVVQGLSFSVKKDDKIYTEIPEERKTTPVRVENPDDPNQYIMETRIDKLKFGVKDAIPQPPSTGNGSGSINGSLTQTAYTQTSSQTERLNTYNTLISQGIDPSVASTMAYGNTLNTGPLPQTSGPDSNATYQLAEPGPNG